MARLPVLLLDDGELDDVKALLDEEGVAFGRVRGGAIVPNTLPPTILLVATPRRLAAVRRVEGAEREPVRMVVVDQDSPTLRARLRENGFDFLVRRPVHREALRLLLLHCLYTGEERRQETRVPLDLEIGYRQGLARRRGRLVDLSSLGCRLIATSPLEEGKTLKLKLPEPLGLSEPMTVEARVLRVDPGEDGSYAAALRFAELELDAGRTLEWIVERLERRAILGGSLQDRERAERQDAPESAPVEPESEASPEEPLEISEPEPPGEPPSEIAGEDGPAAAARSPEPAKPGDRRRSTRATFARKVPAFGSRALRVLVGRDLSTGGMRVEPHGELQLGDRVHLAIYAEATGEPTLVWATVARDDGPGGLGLVFDAVHPTLGERIERLVSDLPAVESLGDGEVGAMGTVVSEILR